MNKIKHKILTYIIASVWLVNGLFCKVLNLVPRHQEIVERISDSNHSRLITILIGVSEIIMTIWILSNYKSKLNAITQIVIVAVMNYIEFVLTPELLLWGKLNAVFAFIFILLVYCTNFKIKKQYVTFS